MFNKLITFHFMPTINANIYSVFETIFGNNKTIVVFF